MLGLPALGLFGRASNLATMIFSNMYGTITRVVFVKLSQDYREHGKLREPFLKWLRVIAGFMGPVLLGLAVLSKPAILLLYGEKWLGAALPLSLLMVAHFIALRFAMNWELFVIRDQLKVQTALEFVRSVVSLFNRAIGCLFGLVGAAVASIVDAIFSIVLYGKQIDRLIEAEPNDLMHATAETIGITFAAIFPAFVLMVWTGWDAHTPLPLVSASVAMGAIFWLVTLAWLRHPLFEEIRSLAANLLMRCSPVARRGLTILGRRSQ
jgi:O-antigen/teichoic acid export membrane protein